MLSNAAHVIRSVLEKLLDAWMPDLGNIYAPQGYQTPISLLDAILLLRIHNSGHAGFNCTLVVSMWTLVSFKL